MTLLWPQGLWLLVLVPVFVAGYCLVASGARSWARHVPPALFAFALAVLLLATARPSVRMLVPAEEASVILAIDVSGSMAARDMAPTRLGAAQAAAREFVQGVPARIRIGVVAFSNHAQILQAPGAAREDILRAIDSLRPQEDTAIGRGILASLQAVLPDGPKDAALALRVSAAAWPAPLRADAAAAVVLLTDGQNSHGPDPLEAARLAAKLGVRVYTIGVGTPNGWIGEGWGQGTRVGIDETSLREIATLTGAEYSYALTAWHLNRIYQRLGSKVVLVKARTEVTALLCAAAALIASLSAFLSLLWFGRVL